MGIEITIISFKTVCLLIFFKIHSQIINRQNNIIHSYSAQTLYPRTVSLTKCERDVRVVPTTATAINNST